MDKEKKMQLPLFLQEHLNYYKVCEINYVGTLQSDNKVLTRYTIRNRDIATQENIWWFPSKRIRTTNEFFM